jgi:adenylate kinase family enzyme
MVEPLPRRVSVIGSSGSGKTTLARQLARLIEAPHVELDALNHQAGWQPLPRHELVTRVTALITADSWVVDGNYSLRDVLWPAADTVVWLDLPRPTVVRQLVGRSIKRVVTRQELWNGNRESLRTSLSWNPDTSLIRWSWTQHPVIARATVEAMSDPAWQHLRFVRLRSRDETGAYLKALAAAPQPPA